MIYAELFSVFLPVQMSPLVNHCKDCTSPVQCTWQRGLFPWSGNRCDDCWLIPKAVMLAGEQGCFPYDLSFLRCRIQARVFSPCPTVPPHLNICNWWPSLPIIDDFPAVFQRKRSLVSIVTVFSVSGPYTPCLHSCHYYSAPYLFSLL